LKQKTFFLKEKIILCNRYISRHHSSEWSTLSSGEPRGIGSGKPGGPATSRLRHRQGFSGLALAKAKILFKVAFDMSNCSLMALWGTMAIYSSIAVLMLPWLKGSCFFGLTAFMVEKYCTVIVSRP
jgi:hypothetical protein